MLLKFDSVRFSYSNSDPVLKSLSFSVGGSEIVGFLGVNGSGKTTSFLLATGLLKPTSGQVEIVGVDPATTKMWSEDVGVLLGGGGVYSRLTVRRNLAFFAELLGCGGGLDLDAHLKEHGLTPYSDRATSQLSQGYRRRLALARATLHQPKLLLLDEPADGLDPAATDALHRYLRGFRERGGGVVFTSHRLEEVESLCDRIVLLSGGEIVSQGTPRELSGGRGLRDLVLGLEDSEQKT